MLQGNNFNHGCSFDGERWKISLFYGTFLMFSFGFFISFAETRVLLFDFTNNYIFQDVKTEVMLLVC